MSRLDELKAKVTSTFGSILKLDSTKKVSLLLKTNYDFFLIVLIQVI